MSDGPGGLNTPIVTQTLVRRSQHVRHAGQIARDMWRMRRKVHDLYHEHAWEIRSQKPEDRVTHSDNADRIKDGDFGLEPSEMEGKIGQRVRARAFLTSPRYL